MAKISVIVPVYNKARFVERALKSLAYQTDKSAQIIVIDDGSTDGSGEICDKYKADGFEVYHTKNGGVAKARNFGLSKVKGEWIAFLDADDMFELNAIEVMSAIADKAVSNIVQFGQTRYTPDRKPVQKISPKGYYKPTEIPQYWAMVWNKMYYADFIKNNKIKFPVGYSFGEDEIFNLEAISKNNGIYCAPQSLMKHYFDDTNSLCRGQVTLKKLEKLYNAVAEMQDEEVDKELVEMVLQRHAHSRLFAEHGFKRPDAGKYDIVYFVKESSDNEELRYSLRSVEQNFKYRNVCFYGGCPNGLSPDKHFTARQIAPTKWERVRSMLREACKNPEITDDFWLFNDDFYILRPQGDDMPQQYNGDLYRHIVHIEGRHGNAQTKYTERLRHLVKTLESEDLPMLNYAVHKPILINKKKMLEVLDKFPDEPMTRALYGNYWNIGGVDSPDNKIQLLKYDLEKIENWDFLSTDDKSFKEGNVGLYVRRKFNLKSRFER